MAKKAVGDRDHLCENMNFAAREAYKKMRTNTIIALPQDDNCKIIGVTSAQPGEGKSTSSINIAYSFSELGKRILLVDADLHLPSIANKFGLSAEHGFDELLTVSNDITSAIQHYYDSDGNICFDFILGGILDNSSELLSSPRLSSLLNVLSKAYDYIFIDLPPLEALIDAVVVGKHADGMIVVTKENSTLKNAFDKCIEQLDYANIKILGVVVNGSHEGTKKSKYYSYR